MPTKMFLGLQTRELVKYTIIILVIYFFINSISEAQQDIQMETTQGTFLVLAISLKKKKRNMNTSKMMQGLQDLFNPAKIT